MQILDFYFKFLTILSFLINYRIEEINEELKHKVKDADKLGEMLKNLGETNKELEQKLLSSLSRIKKRDFQDQIPPVKHRRKQKQRGLIAMVVKESSTK